MSKTLNEAQHRAWNLSTSLMVCVVLLQVDGGYSIMPSDEFDGDTLIVGMQIGASQDRRSCRVSLALIDRSWSGAPHRGPYP